MIRKLKITNIYELHDEEVTHVEVDLDRPGQFATEEGYKQYLYDTIHPLTGVGHTDGNSAYFIESVDGLEPVIDEEYGT